MASKIDFLCNSVRVYQFYLKKKEREKKYKNYRNIFDGKQKTCIDVLAAVFISQKFPTAAERFRELASTVSKEISVPFEHKITHLYATLHISYNIVT